MYWKVSSMHAVLVSLMVLFVTFSFSINLYMHNCFSFRADDLASDLSLNGFIVQTIHGDRWIVLSSKIVDNCYYYREQEDREQALEDFKTGKQVIIIILRL